MSESIQDHLGIGIGETTEDNEWTLLTTSCIGVCSVGPVILVDDQFYGNLTPERVSEILAKVQGGAS